MNILPSLFGFFHLTTNISYGNANYIFIFILSILNFTLILKIFKNVKNIFLLKKTNFYFLKNSVNFLLFLFILLVIQLSNMVIN